MLKFLDTLLNKMGVWFGIVFKITIPAILYYYPLQILALAGVLLATILEIDIGVIGQYSQIIAISLYVIFVIILIFLPKVASVLEFLITPAYLFALHYVYLLLFKVQFYRPNITDIAPYINRNKANVLLLIVFMFFKIVFFFFVVIDKKNIKKTKRKNVKRNRLF